jgi:site-specific recombinase XerD
MKWSYLMMKNKNFPDYLYSFLDEYLPNHLGYSANTINSYKTALKEFITYMYEINKIRPAKITLININRINVSKFLLYLEDIKFVSVSTRNQRLAAIISFMNYIQINDPIYLTSYVELKEIKYKKFHREIIDYLTVDELKIFISQIDHSTENGFNHYVLINIMYDTAARVQEIIDLKVKNIHLSDNSYIILHGKGNKDRLVYISKYSVKLLKKHLQVKDSEDFVFLNKYGNQLTRFGVEYIVNKYLNLAKEQCQTLETKNITPHSFRHSKAIHFLINGTSLPVIQRFLGHVDIKTTQIYLSITSEEMSKAVNLVSNEIIGDDLAKNEAVWKKDNKILKEIKELFRN